MHRFWSFIKLRLITLKKPIRQNWCIIMPGTVSATNSDKFLLNNKLFLEGVCCFGMRKSDKLKSGKYIVKSGEAYRNDNGNQSCIIFEDYLFLSRSKIILQSVRVGIPMMVLIETIAPIPKVTQTGSPLE